MLLGIGASPGIVFGEVLILENEPIKIQKKEIKSIEEEKNRFVKAIEKSRNEIVKIRKKAFKELGEEKATIFDAHLMVLEDPELVKNTIKAIEEKKFNAEFAFHKVIMDYMHIFESIDNDYMRERVVDIKDVFDRVVRNMMGRKVIDLSLLEKKVILVANDLTPSDIAIMDKDKVLGFLTNVGSQTSHMAIMATTLEIPGVVGLKNITDQVHSSDFIILNGRTGEVLLNPNDEEKHQYKVLKKKCEEEKNALEILKGQDSITRDGRKVELVGNIGNLEDLYKLQKNDAEGIGLYRTECMYIRRDSLPTEDEQFYIYKAVLEALNPKPVVIRTLDVGADKQLPYLKMHGETNPALGYRAIRFSLNEREIFKIQLRALLRASIYGNLKIIFPMISSLEELLEAKKIFEAIKVDLDKERIAYHSNIEIGAMIEVPSAAIISDILAKHVDFFSIGTNDLIQYTCAVDRMNEKIYHLYNPLNPAILRLIQKVIDDGHREGIWVGVCGEIAGDKKMIPILLGLGLDDFSMNSASILPARKLIRSLRYQDMKKFADHVLSMHSIYEMEKAIENVLKKLD